MRPRLPVMRGDHDAKVTARRSTLRAGITPATRLPRRWGDLRIEGRVKDMIIRGGEHIYPREIEACVRAPAVAEAAVVGVPDEKWGEAVDAFIRPAPGQSELALEERRAACRQRLAPRKTPLHRAFVQAFPMTRAGRTRNSSCGRASTRLSWNNLCPTPKPARSGQ